MTHHTYIRKIPVWVILLFLFFITHLSASAQFKYYFTNPQKEVCADAALTCLTQGSTWRFQNVAPATDAIVRIDSVSPHATLTDIDNDFYYAEAFTPVIVVDGYSSGIVDFTITFVKSGTSTPVVQDSVPATAMDIDGLKGLPNYLYEWDAINEGGGYASYQTGTNQIVVNNVGTNIIGKNIGETDYPGLDTSTKNIMFTVVNKNISSLKYEIGAFNNYSSALGRTKGIYWMRFKYPTTTFIILPNYLLSFSAQSQSGGVNLFWKIAHNPLFRSFTVEHSTDGKNFNEIGNIMATGDQPEATYSFPASFINEGFFRLKMIMKNNSSFYSQTLILKAAGGSSFNLYPNPATTSLTLRMTSADTEMVHFILVNMEGKRMLSVPLSISKGTSSFAIDLSSIKSSGIYEAVVVHPDGHTDSQKFHILK